MKMDCETIWLAIENAAREHGISCSRLALLSGMDATAFNKSKRVTAAGKPHWPSVETIAKIMRTLDISWTEFAKFFPEEMLGDDKDNPENTKE